MIHQIWNINWSISFHQQTVHTKQQVNISIVSNMISPRKRSDRSISLNWLPRLELKSLTDVWLTIGTAALQILCISRACNHFRSYRMVTWQPYSQPTAELGLYLLTIVLSIILMPTFVATGVFKVGSYASDNFRFGRDLDLQSIMSKSKPKRKRTNKTIGNQRYIIALKSYYY